MAAVRRGGTRGALRPVLFVEGTLDRAFCQALLAKRGPSIPVAELGPSGTIRAAARALRDAHPEYAFVIDRDENDDAVVERSWRLFPDPQQSNILIWRKRELENYLVEPSYLAKITDWKARASVEQRLLKAASLRVWLDAANLVIAEARGAMGENWIRLLKHSQELSSRDGVRSELLAMKAWCIPSARSRRLLDRGRLEQRFEQIADEMLGGAAQPVLDVGGWQDLMCGKELFKQVVNQCFDVRGSRDGARLTGDEAEIEVAKALARLDLAEQPDDIRELVEMLKDFRRRLRTQA